jgi:hypothetical protein
MDWCTPGIRDLPDAAGRKWLAEVAAGTGPGRAVRIVLQQGQTGPAPRSLRWTMVLDARDFSERGETVNAPDLVARGTALVDRVRPGWSWVWIHVVPGVAHLHIVARRHIDAALVCLPGPQPPLTGPADLLARMARLLPEPGIYPIGRGQEGSAHERIAAECRAQSPEGRRLLVLFPDARRPRAVIRSDGGSALVVLEHTSGAGSPLLLVGLPRSAQRF